jgi:hypothetical protein
MRALGDRLFLGGSQRLELPLSNAQPYLLPEMMYRSVCSLPFNERTDELFTGRKTPRR